VRRSKVIASVGKQFVSLHSISCRCNDGSRKDSELPMAMAFIRSAGYISPHILSILSKERNREANCFPYRIKELIYLTL
jgi:hypothetical protein